MTQDTAMGFAIDSDPTRWGVSATSVLPAPARDFLAREVGIATGRPQPQWDELVAPASRLDRDALAGLRAIVGAEHLLVDDGARLRHGGGLSYLDIVARRQGAIVPPDAVALPGSSAEVVRLLAWCEANGVAAVTFGGGTSVVGGLRTGGIDRPVLAVATTRLDEILDIDEESRLVRVGAGMTGPRLERLLSPRGLTLGHYPQSWHRANLGGYAATRSAGQSSTGYGRSDAMIEGVRVVTPRGEIEVGKVAASAAGPDLRGVFLGSEGVFGIITEVLVRVRARPASSSYTGIIFPDYESGLTALRGLVQGRVAPDVVRLSDPQETAVTLAMSGPSGRSADVLEKYLGLRKVSEPCLAILGWDGTRATIGARRLEAQPALRAAGAVSLGSKVGRAWAHGRFDGPFLRDLLIDEGYLVETLETAAHWSKVPALRHAVQAALRGSLADGGPGPYVMCHVSHVYETSASLYFTVIARQTDDTADQWRQAKTAAMDAIVASGGTITHHHAVGRDHAPWLAAEIGDLGMDVLRAVKSTLDPAWVLNPGALLSEVAPPATP